MPIDYARLMSAPPLVSEQCYTARDTILYALGIGCGAPDPLDPGELRFLLEDRLQALPMMAVTLAWDDGWIADPAYGIDPRMVLHGEQKLTLQAPLPVAGTVRGRLTIVEIYDKGRTAPDGPGKGAVLHLRRTLEDAACGAALATVEQIVFIRGEGDFGGRRQGQPQPHPVPEDRSPDLMLDLPTRGEQALLYRLSGDRNPLHADPAFARAAGFSRPILHGLCTYGIAGRAVLRLVGGNDPARLRRLDGRFTAPVYPGETIRTELWDSGGGVFALRARVVERDLVVLGNGRAELS